MNSIPTPQEKAQRVLDFAQKIATKLDGKTAWNQYPRWTLSIAPVVEHCTLFECEMKENLFGLLDENLVTHSNVRGRVIGYIGEELTEEAKKISSFLENARGYKYAEDEVVNALSTEDFIAAMTPIERSEGNQKPSIYSCLTALHEILEYLREGGFDNTLDKTRTQYRKDCRKTFKRTLHFSKVGDKKNPEYIMKNTSVDRLFAQTGGNVLGPCFDTAAGSIVQVTGVKMKRDEAGDYQTTFTFADGESVNSGWGTYIDSVQNLLSRLEHHYDLIQAQAEENAKKGMPVTSGWGNGSDQHKLNVLDVFGFDVPEPLEYVVLSHQSDTSYFSKYRVEAVVNEVPDKFTPVSEPTTYELAQALCVAMTADFNAGRDIDRADEEVSSLNRKMLELQTRLSNLRLARFDKKSELEAVQLRIKLAQ